MIGSVNAFQRKLRLWRAPIRKEVSTHFSGLKKTQEEHGSFDKEIYGELIEKKLKKTLKDDLTHLEPIAIYLQNPFTDTDNSETAAKIVLRFWKFALYNIKVPQIRYLGKCMCS